jgi:hypothetical protein
MKGIFLRSQYHTAVILVKKQEREYSKIGFHAVDPLCSLTLEFNFSVTVGAGIKVQE